MIPEWKTIRKSTRKLQIPTDNFFQLADEYVTLKEKFVCEGMMELAYQWFDMVLYPIYIVVRLCMLDFSPMYALTLLKTYQLWTDWLRLQELEVKVEFWKKTIRSVGGPWISCNNPDLHSFVYADGMERIKLARSFRRTAKKSQAAALPAQ